MNLIWQYFINNWPDILAMIAVIITILGFIYKMYVWIKNQSKQKKILFIDDEIDDFAIIETLRVHGYEIDTLKDVEHLQDEKIKNAKIIFVDYKGVGTRFGKKQGMDLMKALKNKYKNKKKIILFSAHRGFTLSKDFNVADEIINKNAPMEEFIKLIEKYL